MVSPSLFRVALGEAASSLAWACVAASADILKGFRIRQLLIIDSYHRSYLHDFSCFNAPARVYAAAGETSFVPAKVRTLTRYYYVPFLSSVFLNRGEGNREI